jgi:hypothetical protein
MPSYEDLPLGAKRLGAALVGLPRHPFDRDKSGSYLLDLVSNFAAVPDAVLVAVAVEIDEQAEHGELRQQPRYPALAEMIHAALSMHEKLAALLAESSSPP